MHEYSVTQSIVDIVLETARQHDHARVREVQIEIGSLTGIVDDSVRFYFEALTRATPADGAHVVIQRENAVATCTTCGYRADVEPPLDPRCPTCHNLTLRIEGGKALIVQRVILASTSPESNSLTACS